MKHIYIYTYVYFKIEYIYIHYIHTHIQKTYMRHNSNKSTPARVQGTVADVLGVLFVWALSTRPSLATADAVFIGLFFGRPFSR